jgi:hypothetical protein
MGALREIQAGIDSLREPSGSANVACSAQPATLGPPALAGVVDILESALLADNGPLRIFSWSHPAPRSAPRKRPRSVRQNEFGRLRSTRQATPGGPPDVRRTSSRRVPEIDDHGVRVIGLEQAQSLPRHRLTDKPERQLLESHDQQELTPPARSATGGLVVIPQPLLDDREPDRTAPRLRGAVRRRRPIGTEESVCRSTRGLWRAQVVLCRAARFRRAIVPACLRTRCGHVRVYLGVLCPICVSGGHA